MSDTASAVPRRILVTGSWSWTDPATIRTALAEQWGEGDAVLVSGACLSGADRIAELLWTRWGGEVEHHLADWARHGRVFIGWAELLTTLYMALQGDGRSAVVGQTVHGMRGSGRPRWPSSMCIATRAAITWCGGCRRRSPNWSVTGWPNWPKPWVWLARLLGALRERDRWLLIFDDAEDPAALVP